MNACKSVQVIGSRSDTAAREALVVVLATGNDDGGRRATLAFTAATCAAAMDKRTIVFMVGDGAYWASEGRAAGVRQQGFPPLTELMDCLAELGGEMYVCSACDQVCSVPSDHEAEGFRRHAAIHPRGMAAVIAAMSDGLSITF